MYLLAQTVFMPTNGIDFTPYGLELFNNLMVTLKSASPIVYGLLGLWFAVWVFHKVVERVTK